MLLKVGSKGDDVKQLQSWLGLTCDGSFGNKTAEAVKKFLQKYNLTVDGIVGNKTWKLLDKLYNKVVDSCVIYDPLTVHITKPTSGRTIKYLVIHFTAGSNSKSGRAKSSKNTFTSRQASADFVVDDELIVQYNPDCKTYYCWAVGGTSYGNKGGSLYKKATNKNCISIEICSTCVPSTKTAVSTDNHSGWSFTDAVLNNAVKLAKILMYKYDIDIDHVIRHYDVTGKLCPGIVGWNDEPLKDITGKKTGETNNSSEWIKFKERLK